MHRWDDDPFLTQVEAFVEAVRHKRKERILCEYVDAMKSYEFTWEVKMASEKNYY